MLERLRVQGFKSLAEVELAVPRLLVTFGPNASGKSNLLDSLQVLSRLASERTIADALAPPARGYPTEAFTLPEGGLEQFMSQESASFQFETDIVPDHKYDTNKTQNPLRYAIEVEINPSTGELSVADEYLAKLKKDRTRMQVPKPRIEEKEGSLYIRRSRERGHPLVEPLGQNHTKLSDNRLSGEHYPDLEFMREELAGWRTYYLDPRVAMREAQPPREVRDIGPTGKHLAPFLYRLKNHRKHGKRFRAVVRILQGVVPSVDDVLVELDKQRGVIDIQLVQNGTPYSIRVISEGTLRVLALACIAANPWPSSLVAFEEPENGVHPRRLEIIADVLTAMASTHHRQVLVTTHSPKFTSLMLERQKEPDDPRIGLMVCRNTKGYTTFQDFDSFGRLWENQDIREALTTPGETEELFDEMLMRGWVDG